MSSVAIRAVCLFPLIVFSLVSNAQNIVEPSDRAVNGVKIRETASAQSAGKGVLRAGEQAEYLGEVPSWYHIQRGSIEGFVSKGWTRLVTADDVGTPAAVATFEVYVVDVGTGLAIFVHGGDFNLVYDAGSNDDKAGNRFLAFLAKVMPEVQTIDHIIVSHAHFDHISMLSDLIEAKEVKSVWDSGVSYRSCTYNDLLAKVEEKRPVYHAAVFDTGTHAVQFAQTCASSPKTGVSLTFSHRIETGSIPLGKDASMQFLHVDGTKRSDLNENSLVVMLKLGGTKILLPGDSGGGGRAVPTTAPKATSVEGALLACCVNDLPANILVLGHHGSKTSSRKAFIKAIQARDYIVSSGPFPYSGVVLPDQEVLDLVTSMPNARLWRTNENDDACKVSITKIGPTNDGNPGGCDTIHIHIPGGSSGYDISIL